MESVRLSVNINKIALIRNSRGANLPDLTQIARDCEAFGAQGITVHPRPDERHVRFDDLPLLQATVRTEFNIEGNPDPRFLREVMQVKPHQATLVPDGPQALTSDQGWDTAKHHDFLVDVVAQLQSVGTRVSIFVDAEERFVEGAKRVGADRIEFYTGHYAKVFPSNPIEAVKKHVHCAKLAVELGLGINAGHDLNLKNLSFYKDQVQGLMEVSIGHALVCDALYYGLQNTIQMYLRQLN
ncbi:pyridoxine 5'-phosphate synthase [Haliscomenobacter hydrossis]|uniref:Pyridoxine 5'-phosphate synthase n=1 Tax=Haliscomenobacter hydrossis (strain ATCC 27775 / DSM 1100 / LMG 10767 / O) TaxID=760192 RepID=F4KTI2_HALH1|nr:pyridoxine 5'-phosphate synthase [Haliscomenobacter hydrossis]AEE52396.1 Pyridoxine 5'-phosphate synthase [Haliscomenobacter hydrossis DSM 1100]